MRSIPMVVLCLLAAGCGEVPPSSQHERPPESVAPPEAAAAPTPVPDQGTVTKTLGGATVTSADQPPPPSGHEGPPGAAPATGPAGASPPTPDQGAVTKTLGGATVAPADPAPGPADRDLAITSAIRTAMKADAMLSSQAQAIAVSTIDGTITLRGTVASAGERTRIEVIARGAGGTGAAIANQLVVAPRP